ncbi:MAG TPA: DUF5709 domain-containing protein [Nocardioidaceae bacterium]|nr:DUF5709 domain-containing protein [Nocardioidaceae bacterium]
MTENIGDGSREYYGEYSVDDENQLQPEDTLLDRGLEDALDEGYSPPEKWSPAQRFGSTPYEEEVGETLDQRIAQEMPEPDPYTLAELDSDEPVGEVGSVRAGRLVAGDEGAHEDIESELVADDVGISGAGASAEEAAVHIIEVDEE